MLLQMLIHTIFSLNPNEGSTSLSESVPSAPAATVIQQDSAEFEKLEQKSGVFFRHDGGPASLKSLSIRGSTAKDVGIFFEGIRLNSFASGEFDLGLISPLGLGSPHLIKGGHHAFSASPQGALFLTLPEVEATETELSVGDYQTFGLYQRFPGLSFSFDQSKNNYPYERNGQRLSRENNQHQRLNLRLWKKWETAQVWTQVLSNSLELPGPVTQNFEPIDSQTIRPMAAFQYRWSQLEFNTFAFYQRQSFGEDLNQSLGSMIRLSYRDQLSKHLAHELNLEESIDWLKGQYFESPTRAMTLVTWNLFWKPASQVLINPQAQVDYVSDLADSAQLSGSLGSRWDFSAHTSWSAHLSYTSRAPNFNEMYYEIPPFFISNRNLKRESSLQVDLGWKYRRTFFEVSQSVYGIRTNNTISSTSNNGIFQSQNSGAGARVGLENDLSVRVNSFARVSLAYELLVARTQISNETLWKLSPIKSDREQVYQPRHKFSTTQTLFAHKLAEVSSEVYYRSSVRATEANDQIAPQLNWNVSIQTRATRLLPWDGKLQIENLLSRQREETFGYPLGSEPRVTLSLSKRWN
jgi:hypothetical protein